MAKQWSAAPNLLREASQLRVKISPGQFIGTVNTCGKGREWRRALSLLGEMADLKLEATLVSYNAGISACQKGEQWQAALALLSEMREAKLEPDVIFSYSAGISACGKGEQWQRAVALLSEMWEVTLKPNFIQLQRWNQRVREGRTMAAGCVAAQRDVDGGTGGQRHQLQRWHQPRAGRASSGSGRWRCSARCGRCHRNPTSSASTLESARVRDADSGGRRCRYSAAFGRVN
ncbi:unnamed protein product [Prorocentrum cordatum]|uniref:Pentatricopeptide repeat-containing protein, chloroplastic n=1 Tax=Prorocentrum cordatum TaxID=2364126 RepID=A0ABN9VUT2_9DINO|nr:unnamed protein product [Polarella glacialis]